MADSSLTKWKTVVVRALFTASIIVAASTQPVYAQTMTWPTSDPGQCRKERESFLSAVQKFEEACGGGDEKCIQKALACNGDEKAAERIVMEVNDSHDDDCSTIERACPELLAGDRNEMERDRKETRKDRKELEEKRDKDTKAAQEAAQKMQEEMDKLDEEQTKADQEYRKSRKELQDKFSETVSSIEDSKVKALHDAQKEYDKLDVEYIEIRKDLRNLSTDVSLLETKWKVTCRGQADAVARETEKALDERMAAEEKIITNYQATSAAGRKRRALKQKRQKILNMYNQVLSKCLNGQAEPGITTKLDLEAARGRMANAQQLAADRAARLEKLRLQILESMKMLEQQLKSKKESAEKMMYENIQMLDQNHQQNMARLAQRKMRAQQNAMMAQMQSMQEAAKTNQSIDDAKGEETMASARAKCGGSKMSKTAAESSLSSVKAAVGTLKYIVGACKSVKNICGGPKDSEGNKISAATAAQCQRFEKIHLQEIEKKSPSKKGSATGRPAT